MLCISIVMPTFMNTSFDIHLFFFLTQTLLSLLIVFLSILISLGKYPLSLVFVSHISLLAFHNLSSSTTTFSFQNPQSFRIHIVIFITHLVHPPSFYI